MHYKSFFGGLLLAGLLSIIGIQQGLLVTAYQAERSAILMGVYVALHNAQSAYEHIHSKGWCYTFTRNTWQSSVNLYQITAAELNQSAEDLVCHGGTMLTDI